MTENNPTGKPRTTCPICNSTNIDFAFHGGSNVDGPIDGYSIVTCTSCTIGLTDPVPTFNELGKYYQEGFYTKGGGRGNVIVDRILSLLADIRLREIGKKTSLTPDKLSLLDVGCGKGRFLHRASQFGYEAQGTDTSESQIQAGQQRYGVSVTLGEVWEAKFKQDQFDVVTSWHVLEHLVDPNRVVEEVHRVLKPNGVFICEVPNMASWQAKIGRNHWFQLEIPRHLNHYTPNSMQVLLEQHGFELIDTHTFSLELSVFSMLQSILNRIGFPPNMLFQWLKVSRRYNPILVLVNVLFATTWIIPSIFIEAIAVYFGKGGVLRTVARKIPKPQ